LSANLPKHIAIVMDGNGRWAKQHNLPRMAGHRAGLKAARKIIKLCREHNITALTLFAFGSDNWQRPKQEVNHLLDLFSLVIRDELDKLHKQNIRLKVIGERERFSQKLQHAIEHAESITSDNTGLELNIAASYSGQWDIIQATKKIAEEVAKGAIRLEDIDADYFTSHLSTRQTLAPDLLIRTSGELRLSNFMLWQLAYTELYFSEVYWPDFGEQHFTEALSAYTKRQRRFGYIAEQIEVNNHA
jgi:undecaprenyl diphosphate synthase